ncbi:alpha/beta fold hydrolase, partial [Streptomyces sp. NPDC057067]|uniref:alpha/beta fold hydrolase n=1 Tax=Streptomyces sp. NPDC057067 TaxID=3346013 RepID=UPI00363DA549
MIPYEEIRVPVTGGELAALRWPASAPDAPVVVALHGITANALSWAAVARLLAGRATLVAPDLRGRARPAGRARPDGVAPHPAGPGPRAGARGGGRGVVGGPPR